MAKAVSSMTASLRFDGELNVDMNEFQTNLVPFPRLHFMTSSIAPVLSEAKGSKSFESITVQDITDYAFNPASFLVKYSDFDVAAETSAPRRPTRSPSGSRPTTRSPSSTGAPPVS